jgi:metallophosphoesterase (TIGR00282 family)
MRVLCLGDVVGRPGRLALSRGLATLKSRLAYDLLIVNGENASGGLGLDPKTADEIRALGVDVVTLGDHTWQRKEIMPAMESRPWLIRPANYPGRGSRPTPGRGATVVTTSSKGERVGVFNLLGRVFMNMALDCPFEAAERIVKEDLKDCRVIICDMHAEATSEKLAIARMLDGRVSLVFGTHTHVQTADERLLPGGTAFISDLGMCGSQNGVIGMDAVAALERFRSGLPHPYKVAEGDVRLCGVCCDIDEQGTARAIERVQETVATG